jgi:hypothetical protein
MIKEITIQLAGKQYLIKKTYKSLLLFEEETGAGISEMQKTIKHLLMLLFCIIKANNKVDFNFSQFVDLIDNEPQVIEEFNKYLIDSATVVKEEDESEKKNSTE